MDTSQHPPQARSSLAARRGITLSLRLLFALLVGTALIVISAHPAGATTIINGLEFGLSQCPSSTITTGSDRDAGFYLGNYPGPDYASAFAQWVVPTVTPTSDDRVAAFWVGITDSNLERIVQAGVQTASMKGQPEYNAWWEDFPRHPQSVPLDSSTYPTHPGDTMKVTITRTDTSDANWKITIINQTRNWTFSQLLSGFTDDGSPQYEEEIPPPPTPQISPQTSAIQVLQSGYTLFSNSNPQYVSEQKGGCAINGDPVVNAYTSPTTNSVGAFIITTAPSAPPYPYTDYGPGVGCCFSFWGTWYQRFIDGGESGQSIATATGGGQTTAEAAWQPFLSAYSWYQVLAYIPPHASQLGWAHYYFTDNNHAYTQVGVSQAGNYGQWLNLGNWQADGNGHITVKLHNDVNQPGDYLEADAMRFIPVPTSYPANTYGPGSGCCFSTTGTWYSGAGHGLIGQEIWTWSNGSTGSATANWSPKLNQGVTYDIKVYIPNYAANGYVHYYITDDTGTTLVAVNQANYGNVWVDLGDFVADSSTGFITVSLHNDDDAYHTRYVGADAVSFTPVRTCITPPCPSTPGTVVVDG